MLFVYVLILIISFLPSDTPYKKNNKIKVHSEGTEKGHYLEWEGKPILLIGDSITQGWMECGENFNQVAYVDALASRGINLLMLWSYIGTNADMQERDSRIGYNAPEIWPWEGSPDDSTFNLNSFNQKYFDRLKNLVAYAELKNIIVLITVHDGWIKRNFNGHPFNSKLGNGPLRLNKQYVVLSDYNKELPPIYNSNWNWTEKNQYFQERFCEKLITELNQYSNVIYEMFNEGEWYDPSLRYKHEVHFINFFHSRCSNLILSNIEYYPKGTSPHNDSKVNVITLHRSWIQNFNDFRKGFYKNPPKPYLLSEPVRGWKGNDSLYIIRKSMWGIALSGAGWVNQNDCSFGWDTNTAIYSKKNIRDSAYNFCGICSRFFNSSDIDFSSMKPISHVSSSNICLGNPGFEYIIYIPENRYDKNTVKVKLKKPNYYKINWFNPRSGEEFYTGFFNDSLYNLLPPDKEDWVLHLKIKSQNIGGKIVKALERKSEEIVNNFSVNTNYTSPISSDIVITFSIPFDQDVSLVLYNEEGKVFKTLLNENLLKGKYDLKLNSKSLRSGIYYYKLITENQNFVSKMIIIN